VNATACADIHNPSPIPLLASVQLQSIHATTHASLTTLQVHDFTTDELQDIVSQRQLPSCSASVACLSPERPSSLAATASLQAAAAHPLALLATKLNSAASAISTGSTGSPVPLQITMREIMKILQRHLRLNLSLQDAVLSLLAPRVLHGTSAAQQLEHLLQDLGGDFASVRLPQSSDYSISSLTGSAGPGVRFAMSPSCYVDAKGADLSCSSICSNVEAMPAALKAALVHVAFAAAAGEPIMLLGPTCFKSELVHTWVQLTAHSSKELVAVHLSPGEWNAHRQAGWHHPADLQGFCSACG